MTRLKSLTIPGLILLLVVAGLLARDVVATFSAMGRPTSVATVSLQRVFEGLEQRAEAEAGLKLIADKLIAEDDQWQARLEELKGNLDALPATVTAQRDQVNEEIAMAALEYNAWRAFSAEQLDIEKSLLLRNLHRSVVQAIKQVAALNGYDVVLNDDSDQPLAATAQSQVSREVQIRQRMLMQRVLFTDPNVVDITEELIERMNNDFNQGN